MHQYHYAKFLLEIERQENESKNKLFPGYRLESLKDQLRKIEIGSTFDVQKYRKENNIITQKNSNQRENNKIITIKDVEEKESYFAISFEIFPDMGDFSVVNKTTLEATPYGSDHTIPEDHCLIIDFSKEIEKSSYLAYLTRVDAYGIKTIVDYYLSSLNKCYRLKSYCDEEKYKELMKSVTVNKFYVKYKENSDKFNGNLIDSCKTTKEYSLIESTKFDIFKSKTDILGVSFAEKNVTFEGEINKKKKIFSLVSNESSISSFYFDLDIERDYNDNRADWELVKESLLKVVEEDCN